MLKKADVSILPGLTDNVGPAKAAPRGDTPLRPAVSVLEDDPTLAAIASELCTDLGADVTIFPAPAACLEAAHVSPPSVLVLDWRLQDQVGAAAFMALRHRHPRLPVVCWTATPAWLLPQMILLDPLTRVIGKTAAMSGFEAALRWAFAAGASTPPREVTDR
jgi:CheY-like chemotaxis protein